MNDLPETVIKLIQLDELLERLRAMEFPADVEVLGEKFPALPMADSRFFLARRHKVWVEKYQVLLNAGRAAEADECRNEALRLMQQWQELSAR